MAAAPGADPRPAVRFTKLYINGAFVDGADGKTFPVIDPGTEDVVAHVAEAAPADVDAAVRAAAAAGGPGSAWRALDPHERAARMHRLADLIDAAGASLADLEALDTGKPVSLARAVDVATASRVLRYYAGWADKLAGATLPTAGGGLTYTRHQPVGVVAAILPFNFPMLGAVTKTAPALAAGCTVVVKPAEQTPLGALFVASLFQDAGFPPGVFNVVNGPGETVGAALVSHPLVRKVTFTGSTKVGKLIQKAAADSMKRVTLELGGNFFNAGQICVGISRVFVHESMVEPFLAAVADRATKRTLGAQWSGADQGPLVSAEHMARVLHYCAAGVEDGARLVAGGGRWPGSPRGYFVSPTVFADVTDGMRIAREEVFGPVMAVLKYSTVEEALRRANATDYGLAATIIGRDVGRAVALAHELDVGVVWVNGHGQYDPAAPNGGFKQSGLGREYGLEGLLPFTELKTVFVALPGAE
jgi:aldehyde dehydrogenase (NAD+)